MDSSRTRSRMDESDRTAEKRIEHCRPSCGDGPLCHELDCLRHSPVLGSQADPDAIRVDRGTRRHRLGNPPTRGGEPDLISDVSLDVSKPVSP